ncbi:MAG: Mur ligase family protein, partial [Candidatus Paceibacterota bacterium]
MSTVFYWIKRLLPDVILTVTRPPYHFILAWLGAMVYRNPSRELTVIAVTGTKGKSTVVELITAILAAEHTVASLSTIQFRIGSVVKQNLHKMTMPGRFFTQKFLRDAADVGCTYAIIEMTSEGAKQFRHRFIELDALVFTNLTPEHIESHGSFEQYKQAKLEIAKQLERSNKRPRYIVSNIDDEYGENFLAVDVEEKLPYGLSSLKLHTLHKDGVGLIFQDHN